MGHGASTCAAGRCDRGHHVARRPAAGAYRRAAALDRRGAGGLAAARRGREGHTEVLYGSRVLRRAGRRSPDLPGLHQEPRTGRVSRLDAEAGAAASHRTGEADVGSRLDRRRPRRLRRSSSRGVPYGRSPCVPVGRRSGPDGARGRHRRGRRHDSRRALADRSRPAAEDHACRVLGVPHAGAARRQRRPRRAAQPPMGIAAPGPASMRSTRSAGAKAGPGRRARSRTPATAYRG